MMILRWWENTEANPNWWGTLVAVAGTHCRTRMAATSRSVVRFGQTMHQKNQKMMRVAGVSPDDDLEMVGKH